MTTEQYLESLNLKEKENGTTIVLHPQVYKYIRYNGGYADFIFEPATQREILETGFYGALTCDELVFLITVDSKAFDPIKFNLKF